MAVLEAMAMGVLVLSLEVAALGDVYRGHATLVHVDDLADPAIRKECGVTFQPHFVGDAYRDRYVQKVRHTHVSA